MHVFTVATVDKTVCASFDPVMKSNYTLLDYFFSTKNLKLIIYQFDKWWKGSFHQKL